MHRDIARESEGTTCEGRPFDTLSACRQATLDGWTREFNEERPHDALGMKTPAEVYAKSSRPWKGTPEALEYEVGLGSLRRGRHRLRCSARSRSRAAGKVVPRFSVQDCEAGTARADAGFGRKLPSRGMAR